MKNDINIIREKLENLYLEFGIESDEVIELSKDLDEIIFKIQQNRLKEEFSRKCAS